MKILTEAGLARLVDKLSQWVGLMSFEVDDQGDLYVYYYGPKPPIQYDPDTGNLYAIFETEE